MTPWGQVEALITAIEKDPQLRKRFRRALGFRADGSEREAPRPPVPNGGVRMRDVGR